MATVTLTEATVASLFDQSKETADEITRHHPLLTLLEKKGRIMKHDGGESYRKPLMYNQNAIGGFYTGLGNFNIEQSTDYTALQFEIRQCYEPFVLSGRRVRANKGAKHRLLDEIKTKSTVTKARLKNTIHESLMGDGTGFGGIGFDGLQKAVSTTPATGSYGGIVRSANTGVQNLTNTVVSITAANVQSECTETILQITRNGAFPDCALAGRDFYTLLHDSMTAIQRISNEAETGKAGFRSLYYDGVQFFFDNGWNGATANFPSTSCFILNTEYISFDVERSTYCKPLEPSGTRPVDQDGVFVVMVAEGNLCVSAPALQALIIGA